eukprot:CAMPEP_0185168572 /NCGR_PEP_ID=MMETSP1139-20130426/16035_1 /TAXON_ID=298111 /ORGANISM="Pavlova sp., Strain CCMP459" /LENGTH=46 /DNA_ID= /DNA_START= /DNA_END= /DNA_ORIENTATION=
MAQTRRQSTSRPWRCAVEMPWARASPDRTANEAASCMGSAGTAWRE